MKILSLLALTSSLGGLASAQYASGCYDATSEINYHVDEPGIINSNQDEINEILESHRIFYQADDIIVCTTGDGQMISGLEFGLGPYMRDDYQYVPRQVDVENIFDLKLKVIGMRKGECRSFVLEKDDYINHIEVRYSEAAINQLYFKTSEGKEMRVGSDQTDFKNEFNWQIETIELEAHQRLIGAYGLVQRIMGEIRLRTLGFFRTDCLYEAEEPYRPPNNNVERLSKLPTNIGKSDVTSLDSTADDAARVRRQSGMGIALAILLSIVMCCICGYFILKNRGKCFKKLSAADRGEHRLPNGHDSGVEMPRAEEPSENSIRI